MIIECVKCLKKFEVNSDLIPTNGRTIQCGSCNHIWFFNKSNLDTISLKEKKLNEENLSLKIEDNNNEKTQKIIKKKSQPVAEKIDEIMLSKNSSVTISNTKSILSLNTFISFIFVSIISFTALIILLDTFKTPLNNIFPNLELILFHLFESLKDIYLFIKDLTSAGISPSIETIN